MVFRAQCCACTGLEIKVDGFSHKLPLLTERVFACLVSASFDANAFANVKEALVRKYRNTNMTVRMSLYFTLEHRTLPRCARISPWAGVLVDLLVDLLVVDLEVHQVHET